MVESYVERVAEGLVTSAQRTALWDTALRSLKHTLERALDGLESAAVMLLVKDFVLLVCVALEQAGYQVGTTINYKLRRYTCVGVAMFEPSQYTVRDRAHKVQFRFVCVQLRINEAMSPGSLPQSVAWRVMHCRGSWSLCSV